MCVISPDTAVDNGVAFPSQLGWMAVLWGERGLRQLVFGYRSAHAALQGVGLETASREVNSQLEELIDRLQQFAGGARDDLRDVRIDLSGRSPFQRAVLEQCRRIAWGQLVTYGELAARAGFPRSARAVGNVMASNRFPLIVPCHRVVAAGGLLGGFSAPQGLRMKRRLLEREGVLPRARVRRTGRVARNRVSPQPVARGEPPLPEPRAPSPESACGRACCAPAVAAS